MKNLKKIISLVVVASMAFTMFGCSAIGKKSKKDKDDSDISEKDVKKIAETFAGALVDLDEDGIKDISDDSAEDISLDIDMQGADDVYEYWFKKFSTEVDEDSIEVDDDSASVTIKVTFPEIRNVDEIMSVEDWEDFIDDSDETDEEFTLELSYDDDDEKLLVSNADKVVKDYVKVVESPYFDIYEAPSYTTFGTLSVDKSSYTSSDEITITVNCDENIEDLEAEEIELDVSDPNGKSIFSGSLFFYAGAESSISFSGSDCKEDGTYTVTATCSDMELSTSFTFKAGDDDTDPTDPTETGSGDADLTDVMSELKAAPDECHGKLDGDVYTNDFFGFKMDLSSLGYSVLMSRDDLNSMGASSDDTAAYDFLGMSDDGSEMVMVAVYEASDSAAKQFSLALLDPEVSVVTYDGIEFYQAIEDEFGMAMLLKDNYIVFILAGGDDVEATYNSFVSCIKAN